MHVQLCPVLSALSAQQDASVSCEQVSCLLLSKIGTHIVQFLTWWHQKTTKPLSPETLSDWKPLEKVTHRFSSRYGTRRPQQEQLTLLHQTLFLFLQLNQFLAGLILSVMQSIHVGVAAVPSHVSSSPEDTELAQVFLLSYGCGKIIIDCTCTSAVLFGVRWKHLFFHHLSFLSSLWLSFSGRSEAGFGSVGWQV